MIVVVFDALPVPTSDGRREKKKNLKFHGQFLEKAGRDAVMAMLSAVWSTSMCVRVLRANNSSREISPFPCCL